MDKNSDHTIVRVSLKETRFLHRYCFHYKTAIRDPVFFERLHAVRILIVLLVFFIAIPGCTAPSPADPSPQGVLNEYIRALNDRDSQMVHDLLSSALISKYDHMYATTGRDPVYDSVYGLKREGATIQSVEIINQTVFNQSVFLDVNYFWHYSGRMQTDQDRQMVVLIKENDEWKLNTFFPFE